MQTKVLVAARILLRLPRRSKAKRTSVLDQFPICALIRALSRCAPNENEEGSLERAVFNGSVQT